MSNATYPESPFNRAVVMKFGGSSVGSAERIRHVGQLVVAEPSPRIVVLSAMAGVTNTLEEIGELFAVGHVQGALGRIDELEERYLTTVDELYAEAKYKTEITRLVKERMEFLRHFQAGRFGSYEGKQVLAQGEVISVAMMVYHLREEGHQVGYLSALDFMSIDMRQEPDKARIAERLHKLLLTEEAQNTWDGAPLYITEGYICRNAYGEVDNLQRGGSDYTASLIGAALDAKEIQIWTDIDGMHNGDPRVVSPTRRVEQLHYDEAAELAYFGAKILHPASVHPARMANIPVRLLSSLDPKAEGTLISSQMEAGELKAVAAKDGITVIRIVSSRLVVSYGFFRQVFEVFERYRTPVDIVATSEVAISLTIDDTSRLEEILSDLKRLGTVSIDEEMSILCIAGDLNWKNVGFEANILEALDEIPVRMISYGGSNYSVSVLVRTEDKVAALQKLNSGLFFPSRHHE